ncbi:hypothetical protein [Brevundimonas nasdae]|uniref:Uncharacterized protein n=1 Tax=Brevundimonas nasdae TaxID=172043 RepID=A0ABX8TJ28_9CAUL|nr:hypothetical protein [Brevundimonas nasdae]QYC10405.1 hypothetical protein KWG56_17995 [Brevundimonas nasdae]QYC13193.1 hypothetical protein KWG63_13315 [Brevundimonas nasdae]
MRNFVIPALALAAAAVALPAAAQSYGHAPSRAPAYQVSYGSWQSIGARQAELDRRIDRAVRSGQISNREAYRLRGEFNALKRLEADYRRSGLSSWQRADLDRRYDRLSAQVRYDRYGYNAPRRG